MAHFLTRKISHVFHYEFLNLPRRIMCETAPSVIMYDSYIKRNENFKVNGENVKVGTNELSINRTVKMYCCGPTVYDHSHIGHGVHYIYCDLIRRVLKNYCGLQVMMAMGITDIDDKILKRALLEKKSDFLEISDFYYTSFMQDMSSLNIEPADCYLRVTDHISTITSYIKRLEKLGFAYVDKVTKDVYFNSEKVASYPYFENQIENEKNITKKSPKDFVLWKSSKPNEPTWPYQSLSGTVIPGRPGTFL